MSRVPDTVRTAIASPQLASGVAVLSISVAVANGFIQRLIGTAGVVGMIATLVIIALAILIVRIREVEWQGLLPVSLLVYLTWVGLTVIWSQYQWATVAGLLSLAAFTTLGVVVALTRDTIQIVRAFGDAMRGLLLLSLTIEIVAGLLLDTALPFLDIEGNLADFGPIQGIMGSRNQLALVALLALITFVIEFITHSISRMVALGSILMAALTVLLCQSPVLAAVLLLVASAALVLIAVRRVRPERRAIWQLVTLGGVALLSLVAWTVRSQIISAFSAADDLDYRLRLWRSVWGLIELHPLEGWGWIGVWRPTIQPFPAFALPGDREPTSAHNAYLDAWFQTGLVGFTILVLLVGLTFTRSWLLAGRQRNVVFAWPALVLLTLTVTSLAESTLIVDFGWMIFVICCVKAAKELSWRRAFRPQN